MGIFTTLFGSNKNKENVVNTSKLVNLFTPYFSNMVNPELNETFMSAVELHMMHFSKIKPVAYLKNEETKEWLTRLLTVKPNPVMEAGSFWEKVAKKYWVENIVFIYIEWNLDINKLKNQPIKGLWILDVSNVDTHLGSDGEFYLRFILNGKQITTGLDNIIHIARNVGNTEIFGQKSNAISTVLNVINTNYEGIENAIKSSAFLRFVINSTTSLSDEQKKKKAKSFAENYLAADGTGVAYMDASASLTQVSSNAKYANSDEMKFFENKIYNYLHVTEDMIKAKFSAEDFQAYYETNLEPFINKLCNELNHKLFTQREYGAGNRIKINVNELQIVSFKTRIDLIKETKELGLYTKDEMR
ncbi:MAG: phage portal protein, partial [Salinivirgaceae bacterium]|nr:phage portal protein [Salinivirgaceae bacterium]